MKRATAIELSIFHNILVVLARTSIEYIHSSEWAVLGKIGNSGDSGTPHIHYGLQNGKDTLSSEGLPSMFRGFELLLGTTVRRVENLCPNIGMIIKH